MLEAIILNESVVISAVYLELKTDSRKSHKNKLPVLMLLETVKSFYHNTLIFCH